MKLFGMADNNSISPLVKVPHFRQSGMALILLVFLLGMASLALWVKRLNSTQAKVQQTIITTHALATGKAALIAYAIASESVTTETSPRPGNFPCPDTDTPGAAGYGSEQSSCTATNIGRIPWKTLGITEDSVKDGSGEVLWYSVSGNFRRRNIVPTSRITSDTIGTLTVYSDDGSTTLTPAGSEGVAVLIAPGAPIDTQIRNNSAATNYMELKNGRNNAIPGGPFISGTETPTFNDQVLIIRTRDFMPIIETRVAHELKTILQNYYAVNGVYPYPAKYNNCGATCDSATTECRGRIPLTAAPFDWTGNYQLPQWFMNNRWYQVIPYAVGSASLASPVVSCANQVSVSLDQHKALFFMPGIPIGAITRPSNALSSYLEDSENNEEWTAGNHVYVSPTTSSNDSLYVLD